MALAGTVHTDKRQIAADDYFTGLFSTALDEGEIVTKVAFKVPAESGYAKFRNPASLYPMAGVFIAKHKDGSVRVAVTGAGNNGVFRWKAAEEALAKSFSADALKGLKVDASGMMGDIHGSAEYRANLVAVMARRAMENLGKADVGLGDCTCPKMSSCPDLIRASIPSTFRNSETATEWIAGSSPAMTTKVG